MSLEAEEVCQVHYSANVMGEHKVSVSTKADYAAFIQLSRFLKKDEIQFFFPWYKNEATLSRSHGVMVPFVQSPNQPQIWAFLMVSND